MHWFIISICTSTVILRYIQRPCLNARAAFLHNILSRMMGLVYAAKMSDLFFDFVALYSSHSVAEVVIARRTVHPVLFGHSHERLRLASRSFLHVRFFSYPLGAVAFKAHYKVLVLCGYVFCVCTIRG